MKEGQKVKAITGRHKGRKGVVTQILLPENNHGEHLATVQLDDGAYFMLIKNLQVLED